MSGVDLVLDVDGVFNAYPPIGRRQRTGVPALDWGWQCPALEVEVDGFPITYSTDLVARVNALAERPDVTPYWLTTWLDRAPVNLCPTLGLNGSQWPVLGVEDYHHRWSTGWWKHPAVRRHVETALAEDAERRFVWVDDDLAFEREARAWVVGLNYSTPRVLGLAPETHNGLTLDHLDLIEHWIETGELP